MRLTVLGCWAPYPRAGGACSGYLVQDGDVNIMLESGNGSFSNLCRHIDFRDLDALVISHLHPDHYLDIFSIYHAIAGAIRENRRSGPLQVYLPGQPLEVVQGLQEKEPLEIITYESLPRGNTYQAAVKDLFLEFLPVPHSMPGYAVSITGKSGKFVFSGDCGPNDALVSLAREAGLYLSESSGLDQDGEYLHGVHHTARQAGQAARQAGVKKFLLTHFWPEHSREEMARQAGEGYGGPVEPARENHTYEIGI